MSFQDAWLALGRLMFELPFSRTHELEADAIGTVLCAKACYDPAAAIRVWKGHPPPLLSMNWPRLT